MAFGKRLWAWLVGAGILKWLVWPRVHGQQHLGSHADVGLLLQQISDYAFYLLDANGCVATWNAGAARIMGYAEREIVGRHFAVFFSPTDVAQGKPARALSIATAEGVYREHGWRIAQDGHRFWAEATLTALHDRRGRLYGFAKLTRDITETKRMEDALRESEERLRVMFDHAPVGIAECTTTGRLMAANPRLCAMLGYAADELNMRYLDDILHPADSDAAQACFQQLLANGSDTCAYMARCVRRDRSFVWVNVSMSASRHTETGEPQCIIGIVEDVTAKKRAEEDLRNALERTFYLATHDPLTDLANRAHFQERQRDALAYAMRDGHQVAILLLDLDRFKHVNDTFGHQIGDQLLQEVARRIRHTIRATDVAARLGGDEFGIIQTHLLEPEAAGRLAAKLVDELGRPYHLDGHEIQSGASIGVALYPRDAEQPEQLMLFADLALYEAKHGGRHACHFYSATLSEAVKVQRQFESELSRAFQAEEFCLYYQPQYELSSGRMIGIEALLRWHHPERGLLPAHAFIQHADSLGLAAPLGHWILRTACLQHAAWVRGGFDVPLTLNVSTKQLRHPHFAASVEQILAETRLPPGSLEFEVQEKVLLDDKAARGVLFRMKEAGARISLDDFGTGSTAFSCLYEFPLDVVKPARSLVQELPSRTVKTAIAEAILQVAGNLQIMVCATGVETAEQYAYLKEHGCRAAQGHYFSAPLTANEMTRLVQQQVQAH